MDEVNLVLFIIILLLILSLRSNIKARFNSLESEIKRLRAELIKTAGNTISAVVEPPTPEDVTMPAAVRQEQPVPTPTLNVEKSLTEELGDLLQNAGKGPDLRTAIPEPKQAKAPEPLLTRGETEKVFVPREAKPSFLERNPDLEKFIGENLVSKIGIAILVLAIGFFVKFAIDNEWIGAVGRVGIGILCGGILVVVAHRLRNNYKAFSSVLVGGGLAIFYFTITLAYHQYHLFSQTVAFIIMVVITAFSVVLSQLYNRQELAIIALIGGFATPFMVSNGSGNYRSLFSYLIILNSGLLFIAYNKAWRLLNLLAFLFTVILFASWFVSLNSTIPASTYRNAFLFATVFYLLFFITNIAHNISENKKFIASDFGILLANTCVYFAAGLYCLQMMNGGEYKGLFTASMGVFNLAASYILFRRQKIDSNILYLLIGITLSFISLTAPIQLNGHNITLFWASEAVLLYWLFQKSKMRIIRLASLIVWSAMIISLFIDWVKVYGSFSGRFPVILNKGFITTVFCAAACYLLFMLRRKDQLQGTVQPGFFPGYQLFRISGILLLFVAGYLEISYQFHKNYPGSDLYVLYLLTYTFAFVLIFAMITGYVKSLYASWYVRAGVLTISVLIYLLSIQEVFRIQRTMLESNRFNNHFIAHWVGAVIMGSIIYRLISLFRYKTEPIRVGNNLLTWALCIVLVIYLSAEVHLLVNQLYYSVDNSLANIQRVYVKAGLPILWGLCSFYFMWLGMKHKFRPLRIISLSLFTVILIKLFVFDIRNIPVAGKIAAFFSLGVLLLIVSFMYQRLKKIIIEDDKKQPV